MIGWLLVMFLVAGPGLVTITDVLDYPDRQSCERAAHRIMSSPTPFYAVCVESSFRGS